MHCLVPSTECCLQNQQQLKKKTRLCVWEVYVPWFVYYYNTANTACIKYGNRYLRNVGVFAHEAVWPSGKIFS